MSTVGLVFTPGAPLKEDPDFVAVGFKFLPQHLRPHIDEAFVASYRSIIDATGSAFREIMLVPSVEVVKMEAGTGARDFLRKGGRVDHVLDMVLRRAEDRSPLGDGEAMEWSSLPHCANDLNFELVREVLGLGRGRLGPY